ncbi:MAG: GldG family protein [Myxococcota bacterium]|jgi:gliding-associated putative ABC transporter substrate-binding component GldG|nr:GldG family protein [Myxococcota bacterium]
MKSKTKIRTESTVFLLTLVGIVVLVNLLATKAVLRGDLTRDGVFTLSGASTRLVSSLDDKLVVKAYFTENLPGRYATLERQVRDLLEEYAQHSNGKMEVQFIDPASDAKEEEIAKSLGITKQANPDIEKDQATVKEGYRGIAFSYGDKTDAIPAVQSPVGLEYEITTTLKKILGKKSKVGFLNGHEEPQISPPPRSQEEQQQMMMQDPNSRGAYRNVRANLDIYDYKDVNLEQGNQPVPEDVNVLVIAGTQGKLEDKELFQLDQYLMKGGSIVAFVDGVKVDAQAGQFPGMPPQYTTAVNDTNLRDLLKSWGIELGSALVMDAQAADYPAQCPPIPIPIPRPYPAWPLVNSLSESHPATFRVGVITLPYASSVKLTDEARKKAGATELAFSSGNSWSAAGGTAEVDPCAVRPPTALESSIPLAAAVKGEFTSYFAGKSLPAKEGDTAPLTADFVDKSTAPGRLLVVGSSGLPMDDIIGLLVRLDRRQAMANFTFVQNALDWSTSEEDLISVRMKNVEDPPLEKKEEGIKTAAKYGNIVGIPALFLLAGLVRWRVRRKSGQAKA